MLQWNTKLMTALPALLTLAAIAGHVRRALNFTW
jgi:hypothetical protein